MFPLLQFLMLIRLKQWFPFEVGCGEELRILSYEGKYGLKSRELVLISVVGDASHKNCLTTKTISGTQGGDPKNTKFPNRSEVDYVRVYKESTRLTGNFRR